MTTFIPFPKLARLSRGCVITEKLDGTNAAVIIKPYYYEPEKCMRIDPVAVVGDYELHAQSRTRIITPGKTTDNYGFAAWVAENASELVKLGVGHHFGEWYGQGIQRKYGLTEKRFALFNSQRWTNNQERPACVSVVPLLYEGDFSTDIIDRVMWELGLNGSVAVPGFMDPEGIVIWHEAARVSFKRTFDDKHKEAA